MIRPLFFSAIAKFQFEIFSSKIRNEYRKRIQFVSTLVVRIFRLLKKKKTLPVWLKVRIWRFSPAPYCSEGDGPPVNKFSIDTESVEEKTTSSSSKEIRHRYSICCYLFVEIYDDYFKFIKIFVFSVSSHNHVFSDVLRRASEFLESRCASAVETLTADSRGNQRDEVICLQMYWTSSQRASQFYA